MASAISPPLTSRESLSSSSDKDAEDRGGEMMPPDPRLSFHADASAKMTTMGRGGGGGDEDNGGDTETTII